MLDKLREYLVKKPISTVNPNQIKSPSESKSSKQAQNEQNNQGGVSYQSNQAEAPIIQGSGNTININYNLTSTNVEGVSKELTKDNKVYVGIKFSPNLEQKFDREVAILHVEVEEGLYRVRGRNAVQKALDTELSQPPFLSFSQQMEGDNIAEKLRQILGGMRLFSEANTEARKIRSWLINLQAKLRDENKELSYLVIHDSTDIEIPWEMLELSDNDYLGASIVTVRWQDMEYIELSEQPNQLINLEFELEQCSGNIVAYTNTKDFKHIEQEIITINQFQSSLFENIYDFLAHLEQVDSEISMMFIASHGFFGEDISQMYLGEDEPKQRVYFKQIYDYDFDFLKTYGSIVFMNACHSGRLRRDMTLDIKYRIGFPTFFLKKGAKGVIGTLGKVIDQYAAKVTNNFFAEYQRNQELSVAAILRNIRAEAARNFRANKTEENRRLFIFSFMYVYYGNPMITLRLTAAGE